MCLYMSLTYLDLYPPDHAEADERPAQSGGRDPGPGRGVDVSQWLLQQDGGAWAHTHQPEMGGA